MSENMSTQIYPGPADDLGDFDTRLLLPVLPQTQASIEWTFDGFWRDVPYVTIERATLTFVYADEQDIGDIKVDCVSGPDPEGDGRRQLHAIDFVATPRLGLRRPTDPEAKFAPQALLGKMLGVYKQDEAAWLFRAYELSRSVITLADVKNLLATAPGGAWVYDAAVFERVAADDSIFQGCRLKPEGEHWDALGPDSQAMHFSYNHIPSGTLYDGEISKSGELGLAVYDLDAQDADPQTVEDRRSVMPSEYHARQLLTLLGANFGLSARAVY